MTDGIIQEVIKKIVLLDNPETRYHRITFIILQQELIEKIKQEFPKCTCDACFNGLQEKTHHDYFRNIYLKKLIGDNQE